MTIAFGNHLSIVPWNALSFWFQGKPNGSSFQCFFDFDFIQHHSLVGLLVRIRWYMYFHVEFGWAPYIASIFFWNNMDPSFNPRSQRMKSKLFLFDIWGTPDNYWTAVLFPVVFLVRIWHILFIANQNITNALLMSRVGDHRVSCCIDLPSYFRIPLDPLGC